MSLAFITGSAGAGKSHILYNMMTEEASKVENQCHQYIALVPEQYSMESQKEILASHRKHGSFNIEVVSFARLAYAVFEELNINNLNVMDELGKTLVMRKVLEECKNELIVYKNKVNMPGFVEKAKTIITELKQYNYDENDIDNMLASSGNRVVLMNKLEDIRTINRHYNQYTEDKMISNEDVLNLCCKYIEKSEKIRNSYIYVDSFTGFTPIQYRVLEQLIKYAKKVTVAVTLPENESDFKGYDKEELFSLSKETIVKLKELAIKNSIDIEEGIIAGKGTNPYRIRESEELCHIEKNIFRNKRAEIYEKSCNALTVHKAGNPRGEVRFVANEISKLMLTGNYRYKDFAVITSDMEGYYRYISEEFAKSDIPKFIDYKRSIIANPFVDGLLALIEIIEKDFSYESVFRFLKLGIFDIERDKIDLFENYVIAFGRRGYKSYANKWEKKYQQMSDEELSTVNEVREQVVASLKPLCEKVKRSKASVTDTTKALYEFILSLNWQRKIAEHVAKCREAEELEQVKEYEQIYGEIIGLFDRIVNLLGGENVTLKEYKQLIKAGFESIKVGIIPPGLDTVMVGDLERTRLKDIKKIIFFVGVNDGIVPAISSANGIITDLDRDFLREHEFVLAPTARENIFKERLYLYSLFAKPSEKLYLCYSSNGADGTALRKSYIITSIKKMFRNLEEIDESARSQNIDDITNVFEAIDYVTNNLRQDSDVKNSDETKQIIATLSADEKTRKYVDMMIEGAYYMAGQPQLNEETARGLYGNKHNIGITRLENYAGCAYSQFLNSGLKLKERRKYEIAAVDIGNLYHYSLESFCTKLKELNLDWKSLPEEKSREIAKECVDKVIAQYENDAISSSARNKYIAERVLKNTIKTVAVLEKHLQDGKFDSEEYEMICEHGVIDRVDVCKQDDKVYVKVIDYKSGNKKFNIADTYMGLQMQLMIYLKDALKVIGDKYPEKQVIPAGGFYYVIKDPYIAKPQYEEIKKIRQESPNQSAAEIAIKQYIESIRFKEFKMTGIFGREKEILEALDNTGNKSSEIIPLRYGSAGLYKGTMALEENEFTELLNYVENKAEELKEQLTCGNIDINPVEGKCSYCPFVNACKFDERNGDKCREKEKLGLEEVMSKIMNQEKGAEHD